MRLPPFKIAKRPPRGKVLGATEMAGVLGLDKWRHDAHLTLWMRKAGRAKAPALDRLLCVGVGQSLERFILQTWARETKRRVAATSGHVAHPRIPRLGCSPDAWVKATGEPVEAKTVGVKAFGYWGDRPPVEYFVQVQTQMACMGANAAHLVALVGNARLVSWEVGRSDALIAAIECAAEAFWESVDAGEPPDPWESPWGGGECTHDMVSKEMRRLVAPIDVVLDDAETRRGMEE